MTKDTKGVRQVLEDHRVKWLNMLTELNDELISVDEMLVVKAKIIDEAETKLQEIMLGMLPERASAGFVFFDEDESKGWTPEQLKERVWGYNKALRDWEQNIRGGFNNG